MYDLLHILLIKVWNIIFVMYIQHVNKADPHEQCVLQCTCVSNVLCHPEADMQYGNYCATVKHLSFPKQAWPMSYQTVPHLSCWIAAKLNARLIYDIGLDVEKTWAIFGLNIPPHFVFLCSRFGHCYLAQIHTPSLLVKWLRPVIDHTASGLFLLFGSALTLVLIQCARKTNLPVNCIHLSILRRQARRKMISFMNSTLLSNIDVSE